jgi:3'(2'), 5'-bisphosphate nucleotidase
MIEILKSAVQKSGEALLSLRNDRVFEGEWKGPQYKAKADILINNSLTEKLNRAAPEIPVVSEEDPASLAHIGNDPYFIIDPIDGTASFVHGFDGFVTQAAYVNKGIVEAAAICVPVSGDIYWAVRGQGAYKNTGRLHIADPLQWKTLIDNYPEPRGITEIAYRELQFQNYVESGSISLKICRVADGTADIFFKDVAVQQWDIAAPHLVLAESGGSLVPLSGKAADYTVHEEYKGIVAANSARHAKRLIAWYSKHIRQRGAS